MGDLLSGWASHIYLGTPKVSRISAYDISGLLEGDLTLQSGEHMIHSETDGPLRRLVECNAPGGCQPASQVRRARTEQ